MKYFFFKYTYITRRRNLTYSDKLYLHLIEILCTQKYDYDHTDYYRCVENIN